MCRSTKHGSGRRCPGCGSYGAAAKANGNRRESRLARKKVVDHLREQGLEETAAAVLAAPPSVLAEFMEKTGIDPSILGDTKLPSTHSNPPSAALLVAMAENERAKLAGGPTLTEAQQALEQAQQHKDAADLERSTAMAAAHAAGEELRKTRRSYRKGDGATHAEVKAAEAAYNEAKERSELAQKVAKEADEDLEAAKFVAACEDKPQEDLDAYYATLSDEQVDALTRSICRGEIATAHDAIIATKLSVGQRDTSVYTPGTVSMDTGKEIVTVEGRILDGGTAIHRRGSGDFAILQKVGDNYYPVGHADSKAAALEKANRIPALGLSPLAEDASEMEKGAWALKKDLALKIAREAGDGNATTLAQQQQIVTDTMTGADMRLAEEHIGMTVRGEIIDGTRRHRRAMRLKAADEAGQGARAKALAGGASEEEAAAAYKAAYDRSLGTPTVGGGVIPHFDHDTIPASLGATKHASLARSGIRPFGHETADDYDVVGNRAGDLAAWGFHDKNAPGALKTSNISEVMSRNSEFLNKSLTVQERGALTTYTGGSYQVINAAITGRTANPAAGTKAVVSQLESAFDKFAAQNPNLEPITAVRGTRVPSGWKGSTEEYIQAAFTVGSKVQMGKVTSFSTSLSTATGFAYQSGGGEPYFMVVCTREGLPVKAISQASSEDEVIVPPGANLRTVRVDKKGINGKPTIYLVGEDLVAEADGGVAHSHSAGSAA